MTNQDKFLKGHPRIRGFVEKFRKPNWTMIEALATVGILFFAIVAVYYAVDANNKADSLTRQLLQLQNTTSNFQPRILPYYLLATFNDVDYSPSSSTNSNLITTKGSLNMSFIVFTPHGLVLNFSLPFPFNFTLVNPAGMGSSIPDPSRLNATTMSFVPTGDLNGGFAGYPEAYVQAQLTQVNFTIPLMANFYPNPLWSTMKQGNGAELILGNIGINLSVYDVQTEEYLPTMFFSIPLTGWVHIV